MYYFILPIRNQLTHGEIFSIMVLLEVDRVKESVLLIYKKLFETWPALEVCRSSVEKAFEVLSDCYGNQGKVMICGNGGSASDSEHIVGELMKGFMLRRRIKEADREKLESRYGEEGKYLSGHLQGALPAISLVSQTSLSSAFINDIAADMVFAQQIYGYARPGDVLLGLTTSGNSKNVIQAVKVAAAFGVKTIGMTGFEGGKLKELCDVCICVPEVETYKVQEYHLPVYHTLCAMLEAEFFGE